MNVEQQEEILSWLQRKDSWELGELEYKLAFEYDVTSESKLSYYDLFDAAGISWKKTTKLNQKAEFTTTTTLFSNFDKAAFWKFSSFIVQLRLSKKGRGQRAEGRRDLSLL